MRVQEMGQFVHHHIVNDGGRGLDDAPVKSDESVSAAKAPPAPILPDSNSRRPSSNVRCQTYHPRRQVGCGRDLIPVHHGGPHRLGILHSCEDEMVAPSRYGGAGIVLTPRVELEGQQLAPIPKAIPGGKTIRRAFWPTQLAPHPVRMGPKDGGRVAVGDTSRKQHAQLTAPVDFNGGMPPSGPVNDVIGYAGLVEVEEWHERGFAVPRAIPFRPG